MKEIIRDPNFLEKVNPKYVSSYLNSKGWYQEGRIADKASIWILGSHLDGDDDYEILLPLQPSLRDYSLRISEVLHTLSIVENRSVMEIVKDINNIATDIIRIRVEYPDITDNTIPLDNGIRLFNSTKQLMYSISSSVVYPRPFFKGGRFKEVTDYMEKLRIGQTEPGSYIINIISPISDSSNLFEREVIKTLFQALSISSNFPEDIEQELQFVDYGISANFCDAILNMSQGIGIEGLQFNLTWSKLIERPSDIRSEVNINVDTLPKLEKAKKKLKSKRIVNYFQNRDKERQRDSSPLIEEEPNTHTNSSTRIQGKVTKLEWGEDDKKGRVTVITSSIQRKSQELEVVVELTRSDYIKAFDANLSQREINCIGYLSEEKKQLTMRDVQIVYD